MNFLQSLFCCSDDSKASQLTGGKENAPYPERRQYEDSGRFKRNGIGIYTYDNGDQYDGEWMENKRHGRGKMIYKNGDFFLGEWVMDKKGGRGLYVFTNMDKYEGEWKNDLKDGHGKLTYENGSYYEGEFSEGKKDGKGIFYNSETKRRYSEEYRSGERTHRTILKDASSSPVKQSHKALLFDRSKINEEDIQLLMDAHPEIIEFGEAEMLYYYGICRIRGLEFSKVDPKSWTIDHVLEWSRAVGISNTCEDSLRKQKIAGKVLLDTKMSELNDYLQMSLGDKKKWMAAIQHLKKHYLVKQKQNGERQKQKDKQKSKDKKKPGRSVNLVQNSNSNSQRKRSFTFYSTKIPSLNNLNIPSHPIVQQNDQGENGDDEPNQHQKKERNGNDSPRKISTHHNLQYITEDLDTYENRRLLDDMKYESENMDDIINHEHYDKSEREAMNLSEEEGDELVGKELPSMNKTPSMSMSKKVTSKKPSDEANENDKEKEKNNSSSSSSSESSSSGADNPKKRKKSKEIKHIEMRQLYQYLRNHHISMNFLIPENQITNMEQIGEGGYGKVYKAKWMSNPVAVKTYMKSGKLHKKGLENFLQEVGILNDLRHPNIVLYMGMCIQISRYSLITEYLEWGSLFDILHKKRYHFDDTKVFNIVEDMALGMVYLHAKDVLHRDLKSSNVLMDEDWNVKLCDFGLSEVHTKKKMKNTKSRVGTYQWMAPEVLRKEKYDFPADVYSFGIIIWEILTERIPYNSMSLHQIVGTVGYDEAHKIEMPIRGEAYLIELMYDCLNYHPQQRPSFKQILSRLAKHKGQGYQEKQRDYLEQKYAQLQDQS